MLWQSLEVSQVNHIKLLINDPNIGFLFKYFLSFAHFDLVNALEDLCFFVRIKLANDVTIQIFHRQFTLVGFEPMTFAFLEQISSTTPHKVNSASHIGVSVKHK